MDRPTIVTGAAGFAGSHLVDLLLSQGTRVVAWRRPGGPPPPPRPGLEWQLIDMLDRAAVRHGVASLKPARIYHCAGAAHVGQAWDTTATTLASNVLGTHHVVEALRDSVPDARLLNLSSALVYEPSPDPLGEDHRLLPGSPYGLSKLAQELVGAGNDSGPSVLLARPFNHFGPRQDLSFATSGFARTIAEIEAGRSTPRIPVGNLEPMRDLTDVRDTVRAYQLILERGVPGRPYNVCSGRAVRVRDLLDAMLAKARVPIEVVVDPSRYRPNDLPIVVGDPRRLMSELGWSPLIPAGQTIDDLLGYWRDRLQVA
jgi:GDP-4-dehydro-6-deoxy-D-mannose reductase